MNARMLAVAALLLLVGCASDKPPAPDADANHPANPHAAEAPVPAASDTLASAHATTAPATTQAAGYTCPMHPQISSVMPGDCPICHMTLVAKKAGTHDHAKGAAQ